MRQAAPTVVREFGSNLPQKVCETTWTTAHLVSPGCSLPIEPSDGYATRLPIKIHMPRDRTGSTRGRDSRSIRPAVVCPRRALGLLPSAKRAGKPAPMEELQKALGVRARLASEVSLGAVRQRPTFRWKENTRRWKRTTHVLFNTLTSCAYSGFALTV